MYCPSILMIQFMTQHPSIHPSALWIISSHSNSPLLNISCDISMTAETRKPAINARSDLTLRAQMTGSSNPIGTSMRQFSRFSFSNPRSWCQMTSYHDHKGCSSYRHIVTGLVNTVEPNTIPRKTAKAAMAAPCIQPSFRFRMPASTTAATNIRTTVKQATCRADHIGLYVVQIWYISILCPSAGYPY